MGIYNPSAPAILGQEWVPIRDETQNFTPDINILEVGHTFATTASRTVRDGRFYIQDPPPGNASSQTAMMAVYTRGQEAATGPIRSVIIPCNSGGITGTIITTDTGGVAGCLADPSDGKYVRIDQTAAIDVAQMSAFFAFNQYAGALDGKRIVDVRLLYAGFAYHQVNFDNGPLLSPDPNQSLTIAVNIASEATSDGIGFGARGDNTSVLGGLVNTNNQGGSVTPIASLDLGEVNYLWNPLGRVTNEVVPWRYVDLKRFEASAARRLQITMFFAPPQEFDHIELAYLAMEVLYCEETRLITGGRRFAGDYVQGANILTMRDSLLNADPVLPQGDYTVTLSSADPGLAGFGAALNTVYPGSNAERQLYPLISHTGVQVNVTQEVGQEFTKQNVDILSQLSLHTPSSGPLTEVHAYGRQAAAAVYGSVTATQNILDSAAEGATTWPWVRFYARRFGNTTMPLTITGGTSSTLISVADFDALDEIVDGWKEVSLIFSNPPTMGAGTNPTWTWSAVGERAGSRWEVLGASAPALSGTVGNLFTQVPSPNQLSTATYGQPSAGSTIEMGWAPQYAPPISGASLDATTDAVLIFSQYSPAPTGFVVTTQSQAVSGIGLDCGVNPDFIPSSIGYLRLNWTPPNVTLDTFTRAASSGWGSPDFGAAWTIQTGTTTSFSVNGALGLIGVTNGANHRIGTSYGSPSQDITGYFSCPVAPSGTSVTSFVDVIGRQTDANNYYNLRVNMTETGTMIPTLNRRVGGVGIILSTAPTAGFVAGHQYGFRFSLSSNVFRAKVWDATAGPQPDAWSMQAADTSLSTGNLMAIGVAEASVLNLPYVYQFDNITISQPTFGQYELQRMDDLTDWQTIMLADNPALFFFNDYEARVGLTSSYRLRNINYLNFPGPWTSIISSVIASPGLTGTLIAADNYVMIFTSNHIQTGARTLGYCLAFSSDTTEQFAFPEAAFTQYQLMYGRDFQVAFRPLERGGEVFSRSILVQAAAIAPETLADFTSLRDLAWDDMPYVCVRDQDGNRWFANVTVPQGKVMNRRQLYIADITITEVTDTAEEVAL